MIYVFSELCSSFFFKTETNIRSCENKNKITENEKIRNICWALLCVVFCFCFSQTSESCKVHQTFMKNLHAKTKRNKDFHEMINFLVQKTFHSLFYPPVNRKKEYSALKTRSDLTDEKFFFPRTAPTPVCNLSFYFFNLLFYQLYPTTKTHLGQRSPMKAAICTHNAH